MAQRRYCGGLLRAVVLPNKVRRDHDRPSQRRVRVHQRLGQEPLLRSRTSNPLGNDIASNDVYKREFPADRFSGAWTTNPSAQRHVAILRHARASLKDSFDDDDAVHALETAETTRDGAVNRALFISFTQCLEGATRVKTR
jgi:hypothetical protein